MSPHVAAGLAGALGLSLTTFLAAPALAQMASPVVATETGPDGDQILNIPGLPPIHIAPGGRARVFGSDGPLVPGEGSEERRAPPKKAAAPPPKLTPEERAAAIKKALAGRPAPAMLRSQALDALFKRLAVATDADEAKGIAGAIEHVWLRTDSDTAELLMERALTATAMKQYPLALSLLDKVVVLDPDWGEPWNKRATVRFLSGDMDGAMADVSEVLKREPRHFGALVGMGMMLQRVGLDKPALDVFRRALAIYPSQPEVVKLVDKLTLEVEGRDL